MRVQSPEVFQFGSSPSVYADLYIFLIRVERPRVYIRYPRTPFVIRSLTKAYNMERRVPRDEWSVVIIANGFPPPPLCALIYRGRSVLVTPLALFANCPVS